MRLYKILHRQHTILEVHVPHWSLKGIKEKWVVVINNVHGTDYLVVARPGRGNSFDLAWDYVLRVKAHHTGIKRIQKAIMQTEHGFADCKRYPFMMEVVSQALNEARLILLKNKENKS